MRRACRIAPVLFAAATPQHTANAQHAQIPANEKPIALFNGVDLKGWEGNIARFWSVANGAIVAKNNPADPLGPSSFLLTETRHKDFRLLCEVRLVKHWCHSGIAFRGRRFEYTPDPEQWPLERHAYQGPLLVVPGAAKNTVYGIFELYRRSWNEDAGNRAGGDGNWLVNIGDAGGVGSAHGWNRIELLCKGSRVRVALNGVEILDWIEPSPELIDAGPIGLQMHYVPIGEETEVHFRDLVISTCEQPGDNLITVDNGRQPLAAHDTSTP